MKLVIEIPEETYDEVRHYGLNLCPRDKEALEKAFKTCKPLPKGHNENNDYAECDQFVCSECGIELQDWHRVERDIDDGDITYHEYTFRYCPNCGAEMRGEEDED